MTNKSSSIIGLLFTALTLLLAQLRIFDFFWLLAVTNQKTCHLSWNVFYALVLMPLIFMGLFTCHLHISSKLACWFICRVCNFIIYLHPLTFPLFCRLEENWVLMDASAKSLGEYAQQAITKLGCHLQISLLGRVIRPHSPTKEPGQSLPYICDCCLPLANLIFAFSFSFYALES